MRLQVGDACLDSSSVTVLFANARMFHAIARIALTVGVCEAAVAQENGKTLKELKANFRREADQAAKPQLERYITKLKQLEREAAQSRDYALATRIRDERMSATADWERASGQKKASTLLKPAEASVTGGVTFEKSTETFENWKDAAAKVSWKLPPVLTTGAYSIAMEYSNPSSEVTLEIRGDSQGISRDLPATEGATVVSYEVSALRLSESDTTLSITARGAGTESFVLKSVSVNRLKTPKAGDDA